MYDLCHSRRSRAALGYIGVSEEGNIVKVLEYTPLFITGQTLVILKDKTDPV